jgi:putative transposase
MRKKHSPDFKTQIVLEMLKEHKNVTELASEDGMHPTQLHKWRSHVVDNLSLLFERTDNVAALKAEHDRQVEELYTEIGRLTTQLAWLKKKASELTRDERLALLDFDGSDLSVKAQAELLQLNRSSLYYKPRTPSDEELTIQRRIDEIYTEYPFYGSRRITAVLGREGHLVNRKAIQHHMQQMGIAGICPGPNLSRRNQQHQVYPYLLRGLSISAPNQVWGIDITYIRMSRGWMYLVAVIDWYSRYVVSWELDQSLELAFVLAAVQRALGSAVFDRRASPTISVADWSHLVPRCICFHDLSPDVVLEQAVPLRIVRTFLPAPIQISRASIA